MRLGGKVGQRLSGKKKICGKHLMSSYLLQTARCPPYAVISCSAINPRQHLLLSDSAGCKFELVMHSAGGYPGGSERTVDVAGVVTDNLLDGALGFEIVQGLAGERAVDLQAVDEDGDGDQAVGLDILVETLLEGLVEDDGVDGLVLDYSRKSTSALRSARG